MFYIQSVWSEELDILKWGRQSSALKAIISERILEYMRVPTRWSHLNSNTFLFNPIFMATKLCQEVASL
jgi:hypothetical protein